MKLIITAFVLVVSLPIFGSVTRIWDAEVFNGHIVAQDFIKITTHGNRISAYSCQTDRDFSLWHRADPSILQLPLKVEHCQLIRTVEKEHFERSYEELAGRSFGTRKVRAALYGIASLGSAYIATQLWAVTVMFLPEGPFAILPGSAAMLATTGSIALGGMAIHEIRTPMQVSRTRARQIRTSIGTAGIKNFKVNQYGHFLASFKEYLARI